MKKTRFFWDTLYLEKYNKGTCFFYSDFRLTLVVFLLRDAFKKKKPDLRTLSQKVGGGPDQIPKFLYVKLAHEGGYVVKHQFVPILRLTSKGDL